MGIFELAKKMEEYKTLANVYSKRCKEGLVGIMETKGEVQIQLSNQAFEKIHEDELLMGYEYAETVFVCFEKEGILFLTGYDITEVAYD